MLVKETCRAPENGLVEPVPKISDHAESGIVDQVRAQIVAKRLQERSRNQRKSNYRPRVVKMRGHKTLQSYLPVSRKTEEDNVVMRDLGMQNPVENGTNQNHAKSIQEAHGSHQDHRGNRRQRIGAHVVKQPSYALHKLRISFG